MADALPSLSRIHLFRGMEPDDIRRVRAIARPLEVERGETIIREGDPGGALYLIEGGSAMVCRAAEGGPREILAVLDAGECFGEMALIDKAPRSASVVTLERSRLLVVRDADLERLAAGDAGFAARLYRNFASTATTRLRRADERLRQISGEGERARHQVDRMIDDMLSVISHELRTPVTVIQGAADALENLPLPREKQIRFLSAIRDHTHRLALMLDDILHLADVRFRDARVEKAPGDIAALIREVAAEAAERARARQVEIALDLAAAPAQIRIHRAKMRRALFHLVDNGIKFNREGGRLAIDTSAGRGPGGPELSLSFRDEGEGIPAERQGEIALCFQQGRGPLDPKRRPGLGLGLPLAQSIVKAHGGRLALESSSAQGSTFRMTLPME